jgi:hypothetical protein
MKHVAEMACMDTKLYCPFMEIYFVMPTVHWNTMNMCSVPWLPPT